MSDGSRVATNLRMLLIMEAVSSTSTPMSPTEINRQIGLPKQSIHRLCQTLIEEGFLIRDITGKKLRPAPRTLKMAQGLQATSQLQVARRQILLKVAEATGETVNFVVPEPDGMTYLDRVETDWAFRIELPIGSRVPFHRTASGKCFLASLGERELGRLIVSIDFEQRTQNSLTSAAAIKAELANIRRDGYAIDNEELFDGMVAMAVPVINSENRYIASVAFHGPTQRLSRETMLGHLDVMRDAARQLAQLSEI